MAKNIIEKICLYCKESFLGQPKAIYCSTKHRVLASKQRHGQPIMPLWSSQVSVKEGYLKKEIENLKALLDERDAEITRLQAQNDGLYDQLTAIGTKDSEMEKMAEIANMEAVDEVPIEVEHETIQAVSADFLKYVGKSKDDSLWGRFGVMDFGIDKKQVLKSGTWEQLMSNFRAGRKTFWIYSNRHVTRKYVKYRFWLELDGRAIVGKYEGSFDA